MRTPAAATLLVLLAATASAQDADPALAAIRDQERLRASQTTQIAGAFGRVEDRVRDSAATERAAREAEEAAHAHDRPWWDVPHKGPIALGALALSAACGFLLVLRRSSQPSR